MNFLKTSILLTGVLAIQTAFTMPNPPNSKNAPCEQEPAKADTLPLAFTNPSLRDSGYVSLFNGKDFTGWWNTCISFHSEGGKGAFWQVSTADSAIYSTQDENSGSILMTRAKYENYQITFDMWATYGNDAGVFNRSDKQGISLQTVLDYLDGRSVGGFWTEQGWWTAGSMNQAQAWFYMDGPDRIKDVNSGQFKAKWTDIWDHQNWTQVSVKVYGKKPIMESYFRKKSTDPWVMGYRAVTNESNRPTTGYIGLQVHGNGFNWSEGNKPNWYRRIKVRKLLENGSVPSLLDTVVIALNKQPIGKSKILFDGQSVQINLVKAATVQILNNRGQILSTQNFTKGLHSFKPAVQGAQILLLRIQSEGQSITKPLTFLGK